MTHPGYKSKSGAPPFEPDQRHGRVDIYNLETSVLLRWFNEERTELLSEMFLDPAEAWVTGILLQRVGGSCRG